MIKSSIIFAYLVLMIFTSCENSKSGKQNSTYTDSFHLWVDTSLSVLVNEETKSFENIYRDKKLIIENKSENQIINALLANTISSAVLHRTLTANEIAYLKKKEDFTPKQYVFAYDAYVFLTRKDNLINSLSVSEIQDYLKAKQKSTFTLSVENNTCQAIHYLNTYFNLQGKISSNLYASSNLKTLMEYIRTNKDAVAVLPFSYITDIEAASTVEFLKELKVLPITYIDSTGKSASAIASQETITTKAYPFVSPLVLVNCNMQEKLGTTFVNFIYKSKAQRLILKFGLCPAIFPGREIRINSN